MLSKKSKKKRIGLQGIILAGFISFCVYVIFLYTPEIKEQAERMALNAIERMYGQELSSLAAKHSLPPEYLKALIMLETSGRKRIPPRYEAHVYEELIALQQHRRTRYEHVRAQHLKGKNASYLKELASSWGPFQIMGYKSIELGLDISDLHGPKAIEHGVYWINKDYGHILRRKQYKDAFHYHNTGRRHPQKAPSQTHDPKYVSRGLRYMEYFKNHAVKYN
jgi:hypothetical protein